MNRVIYLALMPFCLVCLAAPVWAQSISDPFNNKIINEELNDHEEVTRQGFKRFCNAHFPGVIEEFARTVHEDEGDLYETAVEELVHLHMEYQEMIEENRSEEAAKYLAYKSNEFRSWQLGKEIRELRMAWLNDGKDANKQAIEQKEKVLYQVLEEQYLQKLEYQKREFEEMRRELAALERALKKREALKDEIIRRRIMELTDDEDVIDWD